MIAFAPLLSLLDLVEGRRSSVSNSHTGILLVDGKSRPEPASIEYLDMPT